jgi:Uncharacterized conserved protein related to C-terminal domain of eukaryotic chaperone, SACSIN
MNPIALEYIQKAEGDFATAERELKVVKDTNYDAVCFHAQQCAEKYLKARLQESAIPFSKTHDLSLLLDLTLSIEPALDVLRADLQMLSAFAVAYRYPGDSVDAQDANDAMEKCRNFRDIMRRSLGL